MPDREKVINALRQCVGYEDVDNKYTCIYDGDTNPNCPYGGTGGDGVSCMTKMMRDALALLKAQEPRVMTLEEAKSAFVVEYRSGKMREVGSAMLDLDVDPLNAEYGKIYRVWTSRPTDAQMEATPWE